jgi:peptidoglycan/LPS O-acetylase OafA/YrhL
MTGTGEGSTGFLSQIESLRGFAALSVAYAHCAIVLLPYLGMFERDPATALAGAYALQPIELIANARAAVILFFVISGLVLSLALDKARPASWLSGFGAFVGRRALRLYPAHLVSLLLFVPVAGLTIFQLPIPEAARLDTPATGLIFWSGSGIYGDLILSEFLGTLALASYTYNPVVWTLQIELLAAFCLPAFALLSRPGRLGADLAALFALTIACALLDWAIHPVIVFSYLPAFYLGCMARTHGRRLVAAAGDKGFAALLAGGFALLVIPEIIVGVGHARIAIILEMALGAFALVSALAWGGTRISDRILLHPAARSLGRVSYSFYLWHSLLLFAIVRLELASIAPETFARFDRALALATFLVSAGATWAVASLSYRWVERPFIRLGRRLGAHERPAPTGTLAVAEAGSCR